MCCHLGEKTSMPWEPSPVSWYQPRIRPPNPAEGLGTIWLKHQQLTRNVFILFSPSPKKKVTFAELAVIFLFDSYFDILTIVSKYQIWRSTMAIDLFHTCSNNKQVD